jgi:N-acetyl-anhydromuramyl-L-alanine amidase AmpD
LQFVSCDQRAWHAASRLGRENAPLSIGIEPEGPKADAERAQYAPGALAAPGSSPSDRAVVGHEHIAPGGGRPVRASIGPRACEWVA